MFQKGVSGNPKGRPEGSKDKKWQSIQAIWDMFIEEYPKLKSNEKARFMLEIFKLHFERAIAQLPKDQSDSVLKANEMMEVLKRLESNDTRGTRERDASDKASVDDRKTEI